MLRIGSDSGAANGKTRTRIRSPPIASRWVRRANSRREAPDAGRTPHRRVASAGNARAFRLPSRQASFQLSLTCEPFIITVNNLKAARVNLKVVKQTSNGFSSIGGLQEVGTFSLGKNAQYISGPKPYGVGFNCELDPSGLSGTHTYRLEGFITPIKKSGAEAPEIQITTNAKDFKCPSPPDRRRAENNGWNALLRTYADEERSGRPAANAALAAALDPAPYRPSKIKKRGDAWQAHHIVPARETSAARLQRLLFRCQVHPNQETNGVWLRSTQLRKTPTRNQPSYYSELKAYDRQRRTSLAKRAYHGDTYDDNTGAYVNALESQQYFGQYFGSIYERTDCTVAKRAEIRGTLGDIEAALKVSSSTLGNRVGRN